MMSTARTLPLRPLIVLLAAAGLAACQCERDEHASAKSPEEILNETPTGAGIPVSVNEVVAQLTATDRAFLNDAAVGRLFDIEVAKLAINRSVDPIIQSYAYKLLDDHTAANERLQLLAERRRLDLPVILPQKMQEQFAALSAAQGREFDRLFVQIIGIRDHRHDVARFERAGQEVQDADLRKYIEATLPALRSNLAAAEHLLDAPRRLDVASQAPDAG